MKLLSVSIVFVLVFSNVRPQEKWAHSMDRFKMPRLDSTVVQSLLPSIMGGNIDVKTLAEQALQGGLAAADSEFKVDSRCLNDTEMFLQALITGQRWAVSMVDAMGKPPGGLLNGNLNWLGSYDECFAIEASVNISGVTTSPYTGRYCSATFTVGLGRPTLNNPGGTSLSIGICVPSSCSNGSTKALVNTFLSLLPINMTGLPEPEVICHSQKLDFDTKAIIVIVVCSIFGLIMTLATAYDIIIIQWLKPSADVSPQKEVKEEIHSELYSKNKAETYGTTEKIQATSFHGTSDTHRNGEVLPNGKVDSSQNGEVIIRDIPPKQREEPYRPGKLGQVLLSFSIYSNGTKILNTGQSSGILTSVNGIRFVSMTWIIFCHNIGASIGVSSNLATYIPTRIKRFTYLAIANAYVSVDTFFTLSGLLVSYLCLKEMKKRGSAKKFNWALFYFHRFWRLTPPYMLWLMFYVCLTRYFSNGPLWSEYGMHKDFCKDTWWKNLLYVNNIVDLKHQCMGWSWYLANDMQFFIVSPLMLIPLYYSPIFGTLSCAAFLLVNFISVGVITSRNHLNAELIIASARGKIEDVQEIYDRPWCRVGPYVVGILAGYILYRTECKLKMPKVVNLIGWTIAIGVGFAIVYGVYDKSGIPEFDHNISALYHATHRTAWGAAVCWVIVACATGNGGFINTLLSSKVFVPLSRLTYCAYLVHPVVHYVYFNSKRSLLYLTDLEESYSFVANVVMSYAVAFIASLTFEAPMMGLEKALLGRGKSS